ncbi:MAG TPA: hypothetical protein VHY75_10375, partial [Steroidobacteraceae bacterium]|nr:hypothetical protein [Steroidobacteraceae bacterium]
NIGTEVLVQQYRAKWDRAFLHLRYDLIGAHSATSTSQDAQVKQVTDWMAAYREAFAHIYDLISDGTIRTTQQANDAMNPFKDSVRSAEEALAALRDNAREREPTLDPALVAQRFGLASSFVLLFTLIVLLVGCLQRLPSQVRAA